MRQSLQSADLSVGGEESTESDFGVGIHESGTGSRRLPTQGAATTSTTDNKEAPSSSLVSSPGQVSSVAISNDKPSPGDGELQANDSSVKLSPSGDPLSIDGARSTISPTAAETIPFAAEMARTEVVSDATTHSASEEPGDSSNGEVIAEAETESTKSALNPAPVFEAMTGPAGESSNRETSQGSDAESISKEARPEGNPSPPLKHKPTPEGTEIDDESGEGPQIIVHDDDTVEESAVEPHKESIMEPELADTLPVKKEEGTPLGEPVTVSLVAARKPARATSLTAFLGEKLRKRKRPEEKGEPMTAPRLAARVAARVPSLTAFLGERFRKRKRPEETGENPNKRRAVEGNDRPMDGTEHGLSLDTERGAREGLIQIPASEMMAKQSAGTLAPDTSPATTVGPPLSANTTTHSPFPDRQSHGGRKMWRRPKLESKLVDGCGRCTWNCRTNENETNDDAFVSDNNRILPRPTATDLTQWSTGGPFCVDVFTDDSTNKPMALSLDIPADAVTLRDVRKALEPLVRAALNPSPKWEFLLPGGVYFKFELEGKLFLPQFLEETNRGRRFSIRTVEEHTPAIIRVEHEWSSKGRRKVLPK